MPTSTGPDRQKRTMTYRVGMRSGAIEIDQEGHVHAAPGIAQRANGWVLASGSFLWRSVPFIPGSLSLPLLIALPIVSFSITIWLIASLLK